MSGTLPICLLLIPLVGLYTHAQELDRKDEAATVEQKRGGGRSFQFADGKRGGGRSFGMNYKRGGGRAFQYVGDKRGGGRGFQYAGDGGGTSDKRGGGRGFQSWGEPVDAYLKRGGARAFSYPSEKRGGARPFNGDWQTKRGGARYFRGYYDKRGGARAFDSDYHNDGEAWKRGGARAFNDQSEIRGYGAPPSMMKKAMVSPAESSIGSPYFFYRDNGGYTGMNDGLEEDKRGGARVFPNDDELTE